MISSSIRRYMYVALLLLVGCAKQDGVVYQNSTIDALLDGNYDGDVTFTEVRKHGDTGLGTVNALDGEMIAIDGRFYQVRSDGKAIPIDDTLRTPLAIVTFFRPQAEQRFNGPLTYRQLQQRLDTLRPNDGHAFAFVLHGRFSTVRTRSVPRQSKPYPLLAEVVKTQPIFDFSNVSGTLVGFWYPESMRHVNVPGYHFHFLTDDRTAGGHVLDLNLAAGAVGVQELSTIELALPSSPPTTRPTSRENGELEKVEK